MARQLTRRRVLEGAAGALTVAGGTGIGRADSGSLSDEGIGPDHDGEYPRRVYAPDDDGELEVALPINVHAHAAGATAAGSAVADAFTGWGNLRWTRVFPDSATRAWDSDAEAFVPPDRSFRYPRLGDEWTHVHVWDVDEDRAAIHAHLDVLDLTASHFHRGDHYGDAARHVTAQLRGEGWEERTPYSIDYGVDDDRRERWGETGDAKVVR